MEGTRSIECAGYAIVVGSNLLDDLRNDLHATVKASRYVVVLDENINQLYGGHLRSALAHPADTPKTLFYVVPPGEANKTRDTKEQVEDWMLMQECDRGTCVVAVGGGVVGDLAGYVAATYMRGVKFVQVPTTLLAMVDSSIGGKTGVDTPAGKNLVGAFHQPHRVYVDTAFLQTLPEREFANGMAEVIKSAAIRSASLFATLEQKSDEILGRDLRVLLPVICETIQIKAEIVVRDEKESGLREILNFGHSVGHGIEALLAPKWLHGECVSVGMIKEAEIARGRGVLSPDVLSRLLACCEAYRLPTRLPAQLSARDILRKMAIDKKNQGGIKRIVIIRKIGDSGLCCETVDDAAILLVLAKAVEVVPKGPLHGRLEVPGSKSISNRVLLMAGLGEGECRIKGLLHSDDTKLMLAALQRLGVCVDFEDSGSTLVVNGCNGQLRASSDDELFLGNAGTAARFLCSAVAIPETGSCVLTGNSRMKERPIEDLVSALTVNGVEVTYLGKPGCLPVRVASHGLPGGRMEVNASVSSQYVSSVLLSAPYAREPVHLVLTGDVVSQPYIDMTVQLMAHFGVSVKRDGTKAFHIPNSGYKNPPEYTCEPDASSASYPLSMAAISGGSVTVDGLGSASLQGDAQFAHFLKKIGCVVSQTEKSTMISHDGRKDLASVSVDLGDMTDTFMTAAVLLATAPRGSTSRITGIANQRVKESNRIEAMVKELSKCGVACKELETGIEIEGQGRDPPDVLKAVGADVHCYGDHRIAMSFAVLGTVWPNIRILDKDCVDKTYPSFWDDLNSAFNHRHVVVPCDRQQRECDIKHRSIIVIGMRAAGKTTLGRAGALALGYRFIDLDQAMDTSIGPGGIKHLIEQKGWDAFRLFEVETFAACVQANPEGAVISCGGGIVDRPENRELLKACSLPVVWINRDIGDIERYLQEDLSRPQFSEPVRTVYSRREPWFRECSTHEFAVLHNDHNVESLARSFGRFLRSVILESPDPLRDNSCFVCLTMPDLEQCTSIPAICEGAHAAELRVDMLSSQQPEFVKKQVAVLRRAVPEMPIIFTVRSKAQGGKFEGTEDEYFGLLGLGVRLGCDFIDMEASPWSEGGRIAFLSMRSGSRIIGSLHSQRPCRSQSEFESLCTQCWYGGSADVVKLVFTAAHLEDCFLIHSARQTVARGGVVKAPVIAICMGAEGRLSRVLNSFMTPVTHALLPTPAAPGQMSAAELHSAREVLQVSPPRTFYLFGSPVALSPSPLMHNSGFQALRLPFRYEVMDTTDRSYVAEILRLGASGGGNITIPLKQTILPFMDELTAAARVIGAVNTVIKESDGRLIGDNTDWEGVYRPLHKALGGRMRQRALLVGAGGTSLAAAYALRMLGFAEVYVSNRTISKAEEVALRFGLLVTTDIALLQGLDVIVSTLPATAQYTVPACLLASLPVVMDVAYLPRDTPLLIQARLSGCETIAGIEMLIEQGIAAHRLWTMREPATRVIRPIVLTEYERVNELYTKAEDKGSVKIARAPEHSEVTRSMREKLTAL